MDSNTNFPTYNGDLNKYLGRNLSGGELEEIGRAFGYDPSRRNYNFISGGNVYRVGGAAGEASTVSQIDSVARRLGQQAEEKRAEAIKPAIASYEATKPEIEKAYTTEQQRLEGGKQPLIERYKLLLDDIKNRETTTTNSATLKTNNELAKRGISSDSGVAQNEMFNVLSPILSEYGNINKQATLDREDLLRGIDDSITGLVPKKTADLRAITQAIADLQAGSANQGITDYLSMAMQGFENDFRNRTLEETIRSNKVQEELAKLASSGSGSLKDNYLALGEGQTLWDLINGRSVYTAPKTYKDTAGAAGGGWF